jgi:aspartyl-tRNA(Asn)/glutamyl-tRNA(Gln) amidotransferase subunit A
VARGEISAVDLTERYLGRIEGGSELNAFITVSRRSALEAAARIDERRKAGEPLGPLAGVPISVKDLLCTRDAPTTCGSRVLLRDGGSGTPDASRGWVSPYDATVVARLRAADAIIIGKNNLDEFAMGSSTESSAFGPSKNPWDLTRAPGGSSGGSAVAVAAGLVPGSLGTDTGGSIRQPAALTGVVGIKPSYGRVSRYGAVAFASSLDQVGPFARDVRSAARILEVIAGPDPLDSTCSTRPVGAFEAACDRPLTRPRIGLPREYFGEGLDPQVEKSIRDAVDALRELGCDVKDVDLPHARYGVATYYLIATTEASSNLARFDGVRFGLRHEPPGEGLERMYEATRGAGFGSEVKRRIMLGTYASSAGYYDAYYRKAQQVRTLIAKDFAEAFAEVDVLMTPVSPTPAFALGERTQDPLTMYLSDVYTLPASLAGLAALSVPAGPTPARSECPSLPVGLQILAPAFAEETLLAVAAAYEAISPARGARPMIHARD